MQGVGDAAGGGEPEADRVGAGGGDVDGVLEPLPGRGPAQVVGAAAGGVLGVGGGLEVHAVGAVGGAVAVDGGDVVGHALAAGVVVRRLHGARHRRRGAAERSLGGAGAGAGQRDGQRAARGVAGHDRVPEAAPPAVGVNVTLTVHEAPAASEVPQVFVCANGAAAETDDRVAAAVPVLVTVTGLGGAGRPHRLVAERQRRRRRGQRRTRGARGGHRDALHDQRRARVGDVQAQVGAAVLRFVELGAGQLHGGRGPRPGPRTGDRRTVLVGVARCVVLHGEALPGGGPVGDLDGHGGGGFDRGQRVELQVDVRVARAALRRRPRLHGRLAALGDLGEVAVGARVGLADAEELQAGVGLAGGGGDRGGARLGGRAAGGRRAGGRRARHHVPLRERGRADVRGRADQAARLRWSAARRRRSRR